MPVLNHPHAIPLAPEIELLCCCAGSEITPEAEQRIAELVNGGLDWPLLLSAGDRHGMFPLLAWHMARLRPANAPAPILQQIQEDFQRRCLENLRLVAGLARIVHALGQQGVEAIAFKGPVQAILLYGNIGLRQFSDLDLLVRPQDLTTVQDVLRSLGLRPIIELDRRQQAAHFRNDCEMEFLSVGDDICVDVHWALTPRHYCLGAIAGMWERTSTLHIGGERVRTLAPEDLLLVLCMHGHKHCWEQLSWLCDLAMLVRTRPQMNFGDALGRASAIGARRMALLALRLAHDVLALRLPQEVWPLVAAEPKLDLLAAMATRRMFSAAAQAGEDVARWRFVLAARERWTDKVACVGRFLFTPTREDWQSLRLPRVLACFYPALRVFRITGRFLRLVPGRPVASKPHWPASQESEIP